MFKAIFPCCLQTQFCNYGRCEVGNVKSLLRAVCVDGFLLRSFPDRPSTQEENINSTVERDICHGIKQLLNFKII